MKKAIVMKILFALIAFALFICFVFRREIQYFYSPEKKVNDYLNTFGINDRERDRRMASDYSWRESINRERLSGNLISGTDISYVDFLIPPELVPKIISISKETGLNAPDTFITDHDLQSGYKIYVANVCSFQTLRFEGRSSADVTYPYFRVFTLYPDEKELTKPDYAFFMVTTINNEKDVLPIHITLQDFQAYVEAAVIERDAIYERRGRLEAAGSS